MPSYDRTSSVSSGDDDWRVTMTGRDDDGEQLSNQPNPVSTSTWTTEASAVKKTTIGNILRGDHPRAWTPGGANARSAGATGDETIMGLKATNVTAAFKVVKKEGAADAKKKKPTTKASANANAATELVIRDVLRATITGQIGEGAYATVYGATCDGVDVALKVEYPPCPWEFLLCKIIEGRSAPDACLTVNPTKMLLHERFSVLVMPRGSGTLQDLLNMYLSAKIPVDQTVTASICLTLFRAMKQLHDNKVVHNDIKPDNILFSISEDAVSVSLIDVGRGVDLELLPEDAVLFGDSETESFRCIEMRERVPWLWQADAYAVASVIHCLILGEYMEVDRVENEATGERYVRSRAKLPRSYDAEL